MSSIVWYDAEALASWSVAGWVVHSKPVLRSLAHLMSPPSSP